MKKILTLCCIILLFICASANAGSIRVVEGLATGKYYNEVFGSWSIMPISIYVDEEEKTYIEGGEGFISAVNYLYPTERIEIIKLLKKALTWMEIAKKEKAEITKALGLSKPYRSRQYEIELKFWATNEGKQNFVILYITEYNNMFKKIALYLDSSQVGGLIKLLEKVPQTLKELKEQEKKLEIFK